MARFLNEPSGDNLSFDPNLSFQEKYDWLPRLSQMARQSMQIQQDRQILRKILGQDAENIMGAQPQAPTSLSGRVMQGMGRMFGVGPENQQLSDIQKAVIEAKLKQQYGRPQFNVTMDGQDMQIPEGMEVVGFDQKGYPMIRKKQITPLEKETAKTEAKIQQSKVTSQYNLNLTTEATRDLSEWLVKGYKEGGAGTKYKAMVTKAAAGGWLPQDIASKYAASGAIVGKRNEVLMKMFPMLTQQIGKEGSVRLIESVIQRIGQTLPDTHTPPALAKEQLKGTIQSLYRISRAIENLNLNQLNPKNIDSFSNIIAQETKRIAIEPDEQKTLDNLMDTAIKPLDEYLGKKQLPKNLTEEDIQHTLKLHPEYTRDQLLKKLGAQ